MAIRALMLVSSGFGLVGLVGLVLLERHVTAGAVPLAIGFIGVITTYIVMYRRRADYSELRRQRRKGQP